MNQSKRLCIKLAYDRTKHGNPCSPGFMNQFRGQRDYLGSILRDMLVP